jgi:hypothetical protein
MEAEVLHRAAHQRRISERAPSHPTT